MSDRGVNKSTDVKATADLNPQARQAMDQMKDTFSNTGIALPEEPIGVGAKWEVKQKIKSQGMTIDQTTQYELLSIDGDTLKAKATITQSAGNQTIQNPAMPQMKMDLVKLSSTGSGEMTTDLRQLVPVQATIDMHSDTTMAMDAGGQKNEMSMKMSINIRMESK
jgi:hypothetical protein